MHLMVLQGCGDIMKRFILFSRYVVFDIIVVGGYGKILMVKEIINVIIVIVAIIVIITS